MNRSLWQLAKHEIRSRSRRLRCGRRGVRNHQHVASIGRPRKRLCPAVPQRQHRFAMKGPNTPSYAIDGIHLSLLSTWTKVVPMIRINVACWGQDLSKPFAPKIETWWRRGCSCIQNMRLRTDRGIGCRRWSGGRCNQDRVDPPPSRTMSGFLFRDTEKGTFMQGARIPISPGDQDMECSTLL